MVIKNNHIIRVFDSGLKVEVVLCSAIEAKKRASCRRQQLPLTCRTATKLFFPVLPLPISLL